MTRFIEVDTETIIKLFGKLDENIELVQKLYSVIVRTADGGLVIVGDDANVNTAADLICSLIALIKTGKEVDRSQVRRCADLIDAGLSLIHISEPTRRS